MKKIKEEIIANYKRSSKFYQVIKVLFVLIFAIMRLLDRILIFNGNIFAKINEVYFSSINVSDIIWFVVDIVLAYIIVTIIEIILHKFEDKIWKKQEKDKKSFKVYFIIFLILIIAWLPYILSSFPGGIYGDTGVSINQSIGIDKLDNHHPLLYTLSIKASIKLFNGNIQLGMSLITIIQILAMASIIAYFVYWLYKRNVSKSYVVLTTLFFMFFKLIPLYVMSNWKDSIFSVVLLAYTITVMEIIYQNAENLSKNAAIIKYVISMFFVAFLRNNGLYIILGGTLGILLIYRKQIKSNLKKFTIISLISILVFYIIQGPVYKKLGLSTETSESFGIPLQQICYVIANDGNITDEQKEFIENICPVEVIKESFTPYIVDSIKWNNQFNDEFLKENKIEFLKIWAQIGVRNPKEYVAEYLYNTLGYWDMYKITNNSYIQYRNWNNEQPYAGVEQTDYIEKITGISILDNLSQVKLISAALWFWILFLSIVITIKNRNYKNLVIVLPALLNWATIMVATPIAFTLRYVYILVLIAPLAILTPIMPKKDKEDNNENSSIDTML